MTGLRGDRPLAVALFMAALFPGRSRAELSSGDGDAQLGTVVVSAPPQAPSEPDRAPAAFSTVVQRTDHQDELASTAELVASSPGAVLHTYGGPGQLSTLSLRGSSSQEVLVLLDGIPLTDAATGVVDLSTLPLAFIDRVEVIRGSVGAIYGPGAMGGVVNLVSRSAGDAGPAAHLDLQGGSFETFQGSLTGSGPVAGGSLLATVSGLSTQGDFSYLQPYTGQTLQRANNDASQLGGLARYDATLGPDRLDAVVEVEQLDRGLAGSVEDPDPGERLAQGRQSVTVRLERDLLGGSVEGRIYGRHQQTDVWGDIGDPGLQHDVGGGAEGLGQWRVGAHALSGVIAAGADSVETSALSTARPELGVGASDEWLLAGGRISVLPALRGDLVGYFGAVSPSLGAALRPASWLELKATVGRSFRAPTLDELYLNQGLVASNPKLLPETASTADVGATFTRGPFLASVDAFASLYEDLIVYELYPPLLAKPFNVGTAGIGGAEAELSTPLGRLATATASYTFMLTRDLHDIAPYYLNQLPYHPVHSGTARVVVKPWAWASAFASVEAQSSQYLNRSNTTGLPPRAFADVGVAVRPDVPQELWVGLDVKNVLDERSEDLYGYPLPGRAIYLTVRLDARTDGKESP